MNSGTYSLKSTPNDRSFEFVFEFLIELLSEVYWIGDLEEMFSYFHVLISDLGFELGPYGDFISRHNIVRKTCVETSAFVARLIGVILTYFVIQGPPNNFVFFRKCFKKKIMNIFSNFFFYLKVQNFRLIMENNFIQMAASAGHAATYMIGPIFITKLSIVCSCISPMASRILSFKAPMISGLSA